MHPLPVSIIPMVGKWSFSLGLCMARRTIFLVHWYWNHEKYWFVGQNLGKAIHSCCSVIALQFTWPAALIHRSRFDSRAGTLFINSQSCLYLAFQYLHCGVLRVLILQIGQKRILLTKHNTENHKVVPVLTNLEPCVQSLKLIFIH